MQPIKPYLLKLSGFLLLTIALQSCYDKPGSWKNDQIRAGKREDFHTMGDEVLKDLKANDLLELKRMMSKELIDDHGTERSVHQISNRLADNKYSLLDEYYIVNKYKDADTIKLSGAGINSYSIKYPGVTRETYIAFYVPKNIDNQYMITAIYGKYSYGWKLNYLDVAPYTINGKTAPELFKLANEEYAKKYLIDAETTLNLAIACLNPASVWQYRDADDIKESYIKISNEATRKYTFPFTINALPTKPMILRVYNQSTDQGSYPTVYYMTHISIRDTNAVKDENTQIKKVLSKTFPGIDKYNKYVYYAAFNKFPRTYESVDRFNMVDKPVELSK